MYNSNICIEQKINYLVQVESNIRDLDLQVTGNISCNIPTDQNKSVALRSAGRFENTCIMGTIILHINSSKTIGDEQNDTKTQFCIYAEQKSRNLAETYML